MTNDLQQQTLKLLAGAFDVLFTLLEKPERQQFDYGYVYRYKEKSAHQAIIQKLARLITGLQAIVIMNRSGFLQEQATLQRTLDEFDQDILFLCHAIIFNDWTEHHYAYLDAFYQEEFDKPGSAIESSQRRPMVRRDKIVAFISKDRDTGYDQSSTIKVMRTINKTYSGFVHGASPQLMELYYGNPPSFHLFGSKDSPFYRDASGDILNYFYRAILTFANSAKAFGHELLFKKIYDFSIKFAKASGRENDLRGSI